MTNFEKRGFTDPNFDDSNWPSAVEMGNNGILPWGPRPGIAKKAFWILTQDARSKGEPVYCRVKLNETWHSYSKDHLAASRWSCKARVVRVIEADPTVARVELSVVSSEEESKAIREKLTKGKRVRIKKPSGATKTQQGCATCGAEEPCGGGGNSTTQSLYSRVFTIENLLVVGICSGVAGLAYARYAQTRS